ncbi:hypothetical protein BN1221_03374 [Brenneria goodwinii]|uniref:Uncharacterized protein n=2 Tax=Brenneria goodwinii TaxID=1109412 RepID=A0A0G4JYT7_9GAMM|nr:hypothetical protein BN1221_03374 [Brenneria goodwinii]
MLLLVGCLSGKMLFPLGIPLPGLPLKLNTNWLLIASTLGLLWIVVLGLRFYFYGNRLERYHLWQEECRKADEAWKQWGQRHMALIKSVVLFPRKITASMIHRAKQDIEISTGLAKQIDYLSAESESRLSLLLSLAAEDVATLSEEIALNVYIILNDSVSDDTRARQMFTSAWQQHIGNIRDWQNLTVHQYLSPITLETWIKTPTLAATLVLVVQHSDDNDFSDGLAVMLMMNDDHARLWGFSDKKKIYRPMAVAPEDMATHYRLFIDAQPPASEAAGLLLADERSSLHTADIMEQSWDGGGKLDAGNVLNLETFIGPSGPAGAWLAMALAADLTVGHQSNYLVLAQDERQSVIGTIQ